ncbi:hypothetical protein AGMMS49936_03200 [Endomicrobiia bacterium]|nr:hypothetical protein AGMMS49936_03200 [Endomicrobiia bacterium]
MIAVGLSSEAEAKAANRSITRVVAIPNALRKDYVAIANAADAATGDEINANAVARARMRKCVNCTDEENIAIIAKDIKKLSVNINADFESVKAAVDCAADPTKAARACIRAEAALAADPTNADIKNIRDAALAWYKAPSLATYTNYTAAVHAGAHGVALTVSKRYDNANAQMSKGKSCRFSYEEILWTRIPEHDKNDWMTSCFGGKIRGFDYDAWAQTLVPGRKGEEYEYRAYYKGASRVP